MPRPLIQQHNYCLMSFACLPWCHGVFICALLIFLCTIKSRSSLLAPAHPGGPGKRAIKRLWCGVVVVHAYIQEHISIFNEWILLQVCLVWTTCDGVTACWHNVVTEWRHSGRLAAAAAHVTALERRWQCWNSASFFITSSHWQVGLSSTVHYLHKLLISMFWKCQKSPFSLAYLVGSDPVSWSSA